MPRISHDVCMQRAFTGLLSLILLAVAVLLHNIATVPVAILGGLMLLSAVGIKWSDQWHRRAVD
jgi:MFS superfamily sulfate permease-like transporter